MVYYYVQSKSENNDVATLGHSQDDETGEVYYKFISKAKAHKLAQEEKKIKPDLKYRIVKVIERVEIGPWL